MIPATLKEAVTGLFSKPSTEGYPFTPKEAPVGYWGRIVFHADKCISCGMCERGLRGRGHLHDLSRDGGGPARDAEVLPRLLHLLQHLRRLLREARHRATQDYHMVARCEDDLVVTGTYLKKKPVKKAPPAACGEEPAAEGPKPRDDGLPVNDPAKCVLTLCAKKCPCRRPHRGPRRQDLDPRRGQMHRLRHLSRRLTPFLCSCAKKRGEPQRNALLGAATGAVRSRPPLPRTRSPNITADCVKLT